ncbi:ApbE superfamily uncharacterized protein (UPF0280 family) [Methanohalophilus levihalophilus]|uniref:UPF0280 family protein n=1 Tax=Methanohalophilus levihalophilus TaxID=1431282 RepID=UPI001AE2768B|nr:UPF0280 family protein [Methanohalophilus levihalophilus]MBP2029686.1 ApbE superfamily uncharacterized protein (UPF0280 family) [Methanohalophilus levihalophilus]
MQELYRLKETIVTIKADKQEYIEVAKKSIISSRNLLEHYIVRDPYFKINLEPHECRENAPEIALRMANASQKVGIGPMSAVAGTISSFAVEAMKEAGATYAVVDNGGDIAYITDRALHVGIYAGASPVKDLAFVINPTRDVKGICTSSGTVGPSISFGMADAAIVFSNNVSLADAAATALGNATDIGPAAVEEAFSIVKGVDEIEGAMVIQGENVGMWGKLPEIIRSKVDYDCITKG